MKGTWGYGGEMRNIKPKADSVVCVIVYAWSWLSEALDHWDDWHQGKWGEIHFQASLTKGMRNAWFTQRCCFGKLLWGQFVGITTVQFRKPGGNAGMLRFPVAPCSDLSVPQVLIEASVAMATVWAERWTGCETRMLLINFLFKCFRNGLHYIAKS